MLENMKICSHPKPKIGKKISDILKANTNTDMIVIHIWKILACLYQDNNVYYVYFSKMQD